MAFQLEVNQEIPLGGVTYRIAEHPVAPGVPYGQEGRQAIVYKLVAEERNMALKVLKPRFRVPGMVGLSRRLASFATLPGLQVCQRTVLNPQTYAAVLRENPDLLYAVLMPWVEGPTWMEVVLNKEELTPDQSLALARSISSVLAAMEQEGLAHCDLSGPNVLLPMLSPTFDAQSNQSAVALVDVEQMFGPDLKKPELVPGGSPGYAHKIAPEGMWESDADRLSGAVLLAEMLAWCDERVRNLAWGESYFDPDEMQKDSERYQVLATVLWERWGDSVARLFNQAWSSDTLADCPTFGDWLVALPEKVPAMRTSTGASRAGTPAPEATGSFATDPALRELMDEAHDFEARDDIPGALDSYRRALALSPAGSGLAWELGLIVRDLETRVSLQAAKPGVELPAPGVEPATAAQEPASASASVAAPEDLNLTAPTIETPPSTDAEAALMPAQPIPGMGDTVQEPAEAEPVTSAAPEQGAADLGSILESVWSGDGDAGSASPQATSVPEAVATEPASITQAPEARHTESEVYALMSQARKAYDTGDLSGALRTYREALALAQTGSGLAQELDLIISDIESKQAEAPPADIQMSPDGSDSTVPGSSATAEADVDVGARHASPLLPPTEEPELVAEPASEAPQPIEPAPAAPASEAPSPAQDKAELDITEFNNLTNQARNMEASGDLAGALVAYQKALKLVPAGSNSHQRLTALIDSLEKRQAQPAEPDQPAITPPVEAKASPEPLESTVTQAPEPSAPVSSPIPSAESDSTISPSPESDWLQPYGESGEAAKAEAVSGPATPAARTTVDVSPTRQGPPMATIGAAAAVALLIVGGILVLVLGIGKPGPQPTPTAIPVPINVSATQTADTENASSTGATQTAAVLSAAQATQTATGTAASASVVYTYTSNAKANGATIVPGTNRVGTDCDDCLITVTLPFAFQLYDRQFNSVSVSDNGNIEFDGREPGPYGQCFPTGSTVFNYSIAAYWTDLVTMSTVSPTNGIFTSVTGSAPNRIFNIEWRATTPTSDSVNIEARLYEGLDGKFDLIYSDVNDKPDKSQKITVGVQQKNAPGEFTQYSCTPDGPKKGSTITFTQEKKGP